MPLVIQDVLQFKRTERQTREIHEREYSKYVSTLRQETLATNVYYLSNEHIKEVQLAKLRFNFDKKKQYERIERENEILSERLYKARKRTLIDDRNHAYKQNLDVFNTKHKQQRINEYKRIHNENNVLMKRFNNVSTQIVNRKQCDHEWKKHVDFMKKTCEYPENIERFVSSCKNHRRHQHECHWNERYSRMLNSSQPTINPLDLLLQLSE